MTNTTNAPSPWTWADIADLQMRMRGFVYSSGPGSAPNLVYKVEVRVEHYVV